MNLADIDMTSDQETNAGSLVGRPDLSDDALIAAIAETRALMGLDASSPETVLAAARAGDETALAAMKALMLPPPVARMQMPVQPLKGEPRRARLPMPALIRIATRGRAA